MASAPRWAGPGELPVPTVLGHRAELTMNRSTRTVRATTVLLLSLACSSVTAQERHDARLREMLDSPVAVTTADFVEGAVPLTVCFDAAKSYHPHRKPFDIEWDFGDGRGTASTAQTCHEYIEPGLYAASVTVTDDEGLRDCRTLVVFVRENR